MAMFDHKLAKLLLEICRYTYAVSFRDKSDEATKKATLECIKKAGKADIALVTDGQQVSTSAATVISYDDKNIVCYQGTKTNFRNLDVSIKSALDWLQNFEPILVSFNLSAKQLGLQGGSKNLGGRVHSGFLEQLQSVQEKVIEELKEYDKKKPLYITGHSQGGAEAALATRAFLVGGFDVAATYTFASPRPGDGAFSKTIPADVPFHRIEFGDDIVPHVPPVILSEEASTILRHNEKLFEAFTLFAKEVNDKDYCGVGRLCYANNCSKEFYIDLSEQEEHDLYIPRLEHLVKNPGNWTEHHHLEGTDADVKAGKKGNYAAAVSDFTVAPLKEGG